MKKVWYTMLLLEFLAGGNALAGECSDPWKEPFVGTTLGGRLEKVFARALAACGVPPIKRKTSWGSSCSSDVSSIPIRLQQKLDVTSQVSWNDRQSLARHFAFIYPSQDIYGTIAGERAQWLLYDDLLPVSPVPLIDPNGSNTTYSYDCAASIAAALNFSSSLNIGVAQTQAALDAAYNKKQKTSIILASARFESPLLQMWDAGTPPEQVQAGMRFYGWYKDHVEDQAKLWLLRSIIDGVATYNVTEATENFNGNANADFSAKVPVATLGFKMNVSTSLAAATKFSDFAVATKNGNLQFVEMPSPSEVARRMGMIRTALHNEGDFTAVPGTRITHIQSLPGLEARFCNNSLPMWSVDSTDKSIRLAKVTENEVNGAPNCDFTIEYDVPATLINDGQPQEFTLDYKLVARQQMQDKSGTLHPLVFLTEPVRYIVNRSPYIFAVNFSPRPEHDDTTKSLTWKGNLVFRDNSKLIDWNSPISFDQSRVDCGTRAQGGQVTVDLQVNSVQQTANASVEYDSPSDPDYQSLKTTDDFPPCSLVGIVKFSTKTSNTLSRPVALRVSFPKAKPAPAAAPAAAPMTTTVTAQSK